MQQDVTRMLPRVITFRTLSQAACKKQSNYDQLFDHFDTPF